MTGAVDPQWYRKIWTLDILDSPWVEQTEHEVDFVASVLRLEGQERVLDLACGFGRHALELARRGHPVVGVDITPEYVEKARTGAADQGLRAEFICADLREVSFVEKFDAVLSLADGAIGYFASEEENLQVFDLITGALKPGGKHIMGVCNAEYARKHFPRRHWEIGTRSIALADFAWDEEQSRMLYSGHTLKYGNTLRKPEVGGLVSSIRLYSPAELRRMLEARGMEVRGTYGGYDVADPASEDEFSLVVCSQKSSG